MGQTTNVPARLHSVEVGNILTGADEILDDNKNKKQSTINQETDQAMTEQNGRIRNLEQSVGSGGTVDQKISQAKSDIIGDAGSDYNTLGKIENKIKEETEARSSDFTSLEGEIAGESYRAQVAEESLRALYESLSETKPIPISPDDTWPVENPEEGVIYRVVDRENTPPQYYSDYMWNGFSMVEMAQYNNAIDEVPTQGSHNLVESGGVYDSVILNLASPYNDPDILTYFIDDENKVFAIQYIDGSIRKLVNTTEEEQLKEMTYELYNTQVFIKEDSIYNDPDVLTYYTDAEYKVYAIQYSDGSIVKLALTPEERHIRYVSEMVSSDIEVPDDNVLKYLTDEKGTCFGYIKEDGTVVIYKADILNYENGGDSASEKQLATIAGLLANGVDNIKVSNNTKFMSTLHNLMGSNSVIINADNDNNKNLRPCMSIIDDDTIDNQIPSSKGESDPTENTGGYFSVLLPFLLSLGAKHGKNLCAGLACEGQRVGLTPIYSSEDTYTELNENGRAIKFLHDTMGWNVFNHSMTAQLPQRAYFVDGIDSALADTILANGEYHGRLRFSNTIVLDRLTKKWYEVNSTKTAWVERTPTKKYALPFYRQYINPDNPSASHNGPWYFNRDFDFEYSWGEWFKRSEELGLPSEKVIVHNGNTTNPCTIYAGRKYAYWSVRTTGTHNYPPIPAAVNRVSDGEGDNNVINISKVNALKASINECIANNTWVVFMSHFNDQTYHRNYYLDGLVYPDKDENYSDEWIIPLKHDEIVDLIGENVHDYINHPPARLGISSWDEWYPAPGTQIAGFYEVLDYALTEGVEFVTPIEGWNTHGNVLNLGVDKNGQTYPYDTEGQTPYTDDEKSYLTIGADMSIRYYNSKQ